MTDAIPITGLSDTWRVPGTYIEVVFGEGPSAGAVGAREVLLCAPMLSSGTYTPNVIVPVNSLSEVITGAGAKSRLRRMAAMFLECNKSAKLYVLPYSETTGAGVVKAVTTATLSGTATGNGTLTCRIGRRKATVNFVTNDPAADIMADMRAILAAYDDIPVAISGSSGACTTTAVHYGDMGGTAGYKPVRIRWNTPGNGLTLSGQGDLGTTTPGADGATTEATQLIAALAANTAALGKYYVVSDLCNTAGLAALKSYLGDEASPLVGHRAVAITAYVGSKANSITLANAQNYERLAIGYGGAVNELPEEIAGQLAAVYQKREETTPCFNFDGYSSQNQTDWKLTPADDPTEWIDADDVNDLINGGLIPISAKVGATVHEFATTTRTLDPTGTYADYRTYERHRVSGADAWVAGLEVTISALRTGSAGSGGAIIMDDVLLASGKPDPNMKRGRGVVTPFVLEGYVKNSVNDGVTNRILQRASDSIEGLTIIRSTVNTGRILISLPIYTVDLWHQAGIRVAESTAG